MIDVGQLNKNQQEAVLSNDQYIRVIAGAGSGKTKVLTTRIAHLIKDKHVYPNRILAITFTNKAANEMKKRIQMMLNDENTQCWISTIHSLCVRILREDIPSMGYPRNFTVIDQDDQKSIIKEAYKALTVDKSKYSINMLLDYIGNNKGADISVERAYVLAGNDYREKTKASVYEFYDKRLKELYALDFDDLLLWTVRMFRKYHEITEKWANRFNYIHVDEFQDIDKVQYELIKLLTGNDNYLYVVGDPDQTIYSWRGADVDIIMNFDKDFNNTRTIILNQNYRSTKNILEGANSVIRNNRNRLKKDLFTSNTDNSKIVHYSAPEEEYEGLWIARKMKMLHDQSVNYRDMAVLYRSNYLSRTIEKSLLDAHIPYVIYGGIKFYERAEIKDALSYLRMIEGADDLAFKRIINTPKRGIGNKTLDQIYDKAKEYNCTMYEACRKEAFLSGKNQKTINEFVNMIEKWRSVKEDKGVADLLEMVLEESGYYQMLTEIKETDRMENLKELINDIESYSEDYPDSTLDEYLQLVSLYGDKEQFNEDDYVTLMTVHAAKGLEYDIVFVMGMSDGIFPSERSLEEGNKGVEEERRLAYVAYTRAKKQLFLTDSSGFSFVLQRTKSMSRFINEIDSENIYHEGRKEEKPVHSFNSTFTTNETVSLSEQPISSKPQNSRYKKGDQVVHAQFGKGIVIKVEGNILTIAFPYPTGTRKIISTIPALRKLSDLN